MRARGKREKERGKGALRLLFLLFAFFLFPLASAHPANVPSSRIKVAPDGTFTARVRFDVIAFATGATPRDADDRAMNDLLDGPEGNLAGALADAAGRFRRGFLSIPGGTIDRLEFPTVAAVRRFLAGNPSPRLPAMLTTLVWGHLPKATRTVAFRYPDLFDTVIQTVEFPYQEPASEPVDPGHVSSTLRIPTTDEIAKVAATFAAPRAEDAPLPRGRGAAEGRYTKTIVKSFGVAPQVDGTGPLPNGGGRTKTLPSADHDSSPLGEGRVGVAPPKTSHPPTTATLPSLPAPAETSNSPVLQLPSPSPSALAPPPSELPPVNPLGAKVATYLRMGFTHIVPQGLDHILFVLGLFLLGTNTKALIKQITAFTVAHSITLALTALGFIRLPGRIVEPVIAISIAFVAIENLFTREVRPWRTAVVFAFGLVHGMGFAEVFADAGLRGAGLLTALLSFNVGVELGQLSVVAMAFGVVGWFRKDSRYRAVVVVPASLVIASVALFWSVERIAG